IDDRLRVKADRLVTRLSEADDMASMTECMRMDAREERLAAERLRRGPRRCVTERLRDGGLERTELPARRRGVGVVVPSAVRGVEVVADAHLRLVPPLAAVLGIDQEEVRDVDRPGVDGLVAGRSTSDDRDRADAVRCAENLVEEQRERRQLGVVDLDE